MQRRWQVFTGALLLLGVLALVVEVVRAAAGLVAAPGAFAVVTATVALLVFSPITVGSRARATHMTFGETAGVIAFAALPPAQAALSCSAAALVLVLTLRTSPANQLFNAASAVTSAAAGGLVAAALQSTGAPLLVSAAGAAVVFGTVSHLQVLTALSLDRGVLVPGAAAGFRQLAAVEVVGTALGLVLAPLLVRDLSGAWRLLPLLLALALVSRRQARLAAERDLLDALAEVTQDLHSSLRHDEVLDALHAHAGRLLPHSEVALQTRPPGPHQVGEQVDDAPLWLVARSGVAQVGVPTEQRVISGLSAAARRALDNARLHRQVEDQARTDALTGLPNRVTLIAHLDRELARHRRHGGCTGLAFLDLDGFKQVNDARGHEAGDALLVDLARHLRHATRTEDLVARLAGDEFCVVFDGVADRAHLLEVARQLRERLERDLGPAGVGVSLGVAIGPEDGDTPGALLHAADVAMYADKAQRSGAADVAGGLTGGR